MTDKELEEIGDKIVNVLKTIYDPEIPVDIYELGLIYDVFVSEENNAECEVEITFDPTWTQDMMSEEAKLELGML